MSCCGACGGQDTKAKNEQKDEQKEPVKKQEPETKATAQPGTWEPNK